MYLCCEAQKYKRNGAYCCYTPHFRLILLGHSGTYKVVLPSITHNCLWIEGKRHYHKLDLLKYTV